jgi:hypothetical protein
MLVRARPQWGGACPCCAVAVRARCDDGDQPKEAAVSNLIAVAHDAEARLREALNVREI